MVNLDLNISNCKVEKFNLEKGFYGSIIKIKNDKNGNPCYRLELYNDKDESIIGTLKGYITRVYESRQYGVIRSYNINDTLNKVLNKVVERAILRDSFKYALNGENGKRVFIKGLNASRNGVSKYHIYIEDKDGNREKIEGIGAYWSVKNNCYHCNVIGTYRPTEILISVGYSLGLEFNEIKQNYVAI